MSSRLSTVLACASFLMSSALLLTGFKSQQKFEEIDVQRINVREPDGTLRLVISNHARLPGIIVRGKETPFARPQAGMLFFNDEGSENGGLIFGGRKNEKGAVVDSGGSLTFDRYDANQIVQIAGVHDSEDQFAGLGVNDSAPGGQTHRRIWLGKNGETPSLALMDESGKKRLVLQLDKNGNPSVVFLDPSGKVLKQITTE